MVDSEDIFELRHRASHPPLKKIFPRGKIHLSPISWNNRTKRSFNNGTPLSMTLPNPYSPSFLSNRSLVFTKTCSNFDFDFAWPILRRSRIFPADRETSCNSAWNIVTRFEKGGRGEDTPPLLEVFRVFLRRRDSIRGVANSIAASNRVRCCKRGKRGEEIEKSRKDVGYRLTVVRLASISMWNTTFSRILIVFLLITLES